ncbi:DUF4153 domain-containing protein [Pirellulaceae bacterium SH449]
MSNENNEHTQDSPLQAAVSAFPVQERVDSASILNQQSIVPTVRILDLILVIGMVAVSDWILFRHFSGYAGWACWGIVAAVLLVIGIGSRLKWETSKPLTWLIGGAVLFACGRLVWQGDWSIVLVLLALLIMLVMVLHDLRLKALPFFSLMVGWLPSGLVAWPGALFSLSGCAQDRIRRRYVEWGVPSVMGLVFGGLFLKANPDGFLLFWEWYTEQMDVLYQWMHGFSVGQALFWIFVSLVSFGALMPTLMPTLMPITGKDLEPPPTYDRTTRGETNPSAVKSTYAISRNTLCCLIGVFGVYLWMEFQNMWFREFPEGFYFSGYAHQGAAWLTIALGLTTIVLSIIFSHHSQETAISNDSSLYTLRLLGQIWFIQNLLLALCVYNRMYVYIDFNGMTRLRILGLLGITCVVAGLVLVLIRIYRGWKFSSLVYRQFWTMTCFLFIYLLIPLDAIVYRYNVRCIQSVNPRPSVQIVAHDLSPEGVMELIPLVHASDDIIREGVRAFLAQKQIEIQGRLTLAEDNWQYYQGADARLIAKLDAIREELHLYLDPVSDRLTPIERFREFAMRWY